LLIRFGEKLIEAVVLAALAAAFFVGWNIGSNDTANTMGTAVGGGVLPFRRAIMLMILFVILGAVLEGWKVMKTVGKGIVVPVAGGPSPFEQLPLMAVVALAGAGLWVLIATTRGLPVSTSQSIVGAVIGAGLLFSFMQPREIGAVVKFGKMGAIVLCWVLTPLAAAFFAYLVYHIFTRPIGRIKNLALVNRIFAALVVITCAYAAYALGANDVGNATGVIYAAFGGAGEAKTMQLIGLFGGVAMAVGALTYSRKVTHTVGTSITRLDAMSAFAAQFGAALTVHFFTQFGIPVSTSQAIVGGVIGAGLVKGIIAVNKRKIGEIGVAWILTPLSACFFSFMLGLLALWVWV
jgi:PiT family inorganic phosphate transporter